MYCLRLYRYATSDRAVAAGVFVKVGNRSKL